MKRSLLLCLLSLAAAPAAVLAEDLFAEPTEHGQFYGAFSLLKSEAECSYQGVACDSTGWKMATGYKFNKNIAVEGAYYDLFSNDGTNPTTSAKSAVNGSGLALAGVGSYPLNAKSEVTGKAGIMAWDAEGSTSGTLVDAMNGTDILLGVGAGYKLNDHWQLKGEYEHVGGDLEANIYSLGTSLSTL